MKRSNVFGESASALKSDSICCHICSPQKRGRVGSLRSDSKHCKRRNQLGNIYFISFFLLFILVRMHDTSTSGVWLCHMAFITLFLSEHMNMLTGWFVYKCHAQRLLVPALPQLTEQPGVVGPSQPHLSL